MVCDWLKKKEGMKEGIRGGRRRFFDRIYRIGRICLPRMNADRRCFIVKTDFACFDKDVLQGTWD